jgi:hypothetical protein
MYNGPYMKNEMHVPIGTGRNLINPSSGNRSEVTDYPPNLKMEMFMAPKNKKTQTKVLKKLTKEDKKRVKKTAVPGVYIVDEKTPVIIRKQGDVHVVR